MIDQHSNDPCDVKFALNALAQNLVAEARKVGEDSLAAFVDTVRDYWAHGSLDCTEELVRGASELAAKWSGVYGPKIGECGRCERELYRQENFHDFSDQDSRAFLCDECFRAIPVTTVEDIGWDPFADDDDEPAPTPNILREAASHFSQTKESVAA